MELSFSAATDVGKKREINEDNFLVDKKLQLFVVADGMGGHASGEVASQLAVHEFRAAVEASKLRRLICGMTFPPLAGSAALMGRRYGTFFLQGPRQSKRATAAIRTVESLRRRLSL